MFENTILRYQLGECSIESFIYLNEYEYLLNIELDTCENVSLSDDCYLSFYSVDNGYETYYVHGAPFVDGYALGLFYNNTLIAEVMIPLRNLELLSTDIASKCLLICLRSVITGQYFENAILKEYIPWFWKC